MRFRLTSVVAFTLLALSGPRARSEVIENFDPNRHNRFLAGTFPNGMPPAPNPTFFASSFDFSGVGWVPTGGGGTKHVTMISDIHYVAATHFPIGGGATVAFRAKDGSYVTRTVLAGSETQIGGSDVLVGRLDAPIPVGATGVSFYPIASGLESQFLGQTMYMFGQSGAIGRNVIGGFQTTPVSGSTRTALSDYEPNLSFDAFGYAQPSPPTDEFVVTSGDSGSPSMMLINGQVSLLGHHVGQVPAGPLPGGTADSFLGFYQTQLASHLTLTGRTLQVQPIPEPSQVLMLALPAGVFCAARRRRAA
jgi:hypothetical protein